MAGLAFFTVLVRWPYRSRILWAWDSTLFAQGVEEYDINAARPHPPGYPVYIALGRVFHFFIGDMNAALVALSLFASAAAVVLLYGFLREVASIRAALAGSVLFSLSPVFFLNGVVALSYAAEAPLAVGTAWFAWRLRHRPSLVQSFSFGLLGGFAIGVRQSLLFTLTPLLVLGALWPFDGLRPVARRASWAAAGAVVTGLAWLVPMLVDTGPARWLVLVRRQSRLVFGHSVFESGLAASRGHLQDVRMYLFGERWLLPVLAIAVLAGALAYASARPRPRRSPMPQRNAALATLVAAWTLPGILFTVLVHTEPHVQNSGYVLAFLPGLYAAFALVADASLRSVERHARFENLRRAATVLAPALLLLPAAGLAWEAPRHADESIAPIQGLIEPWLHLSGGFRPNETAVLTAWSLFWDVWYFPDYTVWEYWPGTARDGTTAMAVLEAHAHRLDVPFYEVEERWPDLGNHTLGPHIREIVLGYSFPVTALQPDVATKVRVLDNGLEVFYFEPMENRTTIESYLRPI